jgi:hypothetical protein
MNIGAVIVLLKLFTDAGVAVSPIGPPAPNGDEIPTNVPSKPICGLGRYAYKEPLSGLWSCLVIPKGR